jgi:DNA-binding transcriptional ArsR family regulator
VAPASLNPALAQLLEKMRDGGADVVPAGWKTVTAWATEWKISQPTARYHLKRMLAAKMVEEREWRVQSGYMAVQNVKHYRLLA